MALLFIDGFDHYATADMLKKWSTQGTYSPTINATAGRRGGGGLVVGSTSTSTSLSKSLSAVSTVIVGVAFKIGSTAQAGETIRLYEGATQHISLYYSSGTFKLYRGSNTGTLLATGTTSVSASTWVYIELKVTIHDTTGAYELRLNGVTEFSATNVDTRNGGTSGVVDSVSLGGYTGTFDDFYLCDTSGTTNNNFLGDCRIDTLYPSGAGNYTQFTPSTGSNYTCVDETTPNTTDYVSSATSGNRDSYAFADLAALGSESIYGVQVNAYAQKSDAGTRSLGTMVRLSGTDADGASVGLGTTTYSYISQVFEKDPSAAAWTEANVNAAEFGVKVTA